VITGGLEVAAPGDHRRPRGGGPGWSPAASRWRPRVITGRGWSPPLL